jgi:uncharacterized protein (DUF2236 family)
VLTPIVLPWPLQSSLEAVAQGLLEPSDERRIDFSQPTGEAALLSPDSVSWRVFKNPVSVFIGGITAVILELAEPRVRTGVWQHTSFRLDPIRRLRRTGLAAMVTIYGARSAAEAMIGRVRRMHDAVAGTTPSGEPYSANDPELLNWVHATAAYGFLQAYHTYVQPLSLSERDRYYAEGVPVARLYGATSPPTTEADIEVLFSATRGHMAQSDIVFEFLAIMRSAPILPLLLRPMQYLLVRAAVDLIPRWARTILGLDGRGLRRWEAEPVRQAAAFAERLVLECHPAVQACRRMRLPADYLYLHPQRGRDPRRSLSAGRVKKVLRGATTTPGLTGVAGWCCPTEPCRCISTWVPTRRNPDAANYKRKCCKTAQGTHDRRGL